MLNLLLKGWFASESGRRIAEDRHSGTLELMLSTPITVSEILHGQWLALRRQFLGPILFVIALWLAFTVTSPSEYMSRSERGAWVAFWLAASVIVITSYSIHYTKLYEVQAAQLHAHIHPLL